MILTEEMINVIQSELNLCISNDEIPVCAIVINKENKIVGIGHNSRQGDHCVTGHAEINAIIDAEKNIGDWRLDGYSMIVTLEPCNMCMSIIRETRLDSVYYLCKSNYQQSNHLPNYGLIEDEILSEKYISNLLADFFNNKR